MRDPNRLYNFYNELCNMHITYFPDWRFGQMVNNLERWIYINKHITDLFYVEENDMLQYMKEFIAYFKN